MRAILIFLLTISFLQITYCQKEPEVELRVFLSHTLVPHGSPFEITLSVVVSDSNKVRVQFFNAGYYLSQLLPVLQKNSFFHASQIDSIMGSEFSDDSGSYVRYDFYRAQIAPFYEGKFVIPSLTFPLRQLSDNEDENGDQTPTLIELKSKETYVKVAEPIFQQKYHRLFSEKTEFQILDTVSNGLDNEMVRIRAEGEGFGLPLELPLYLQNSFGLIESIELEDTRVDEKTVRFKKTFLVSKKDRMNQDTMANSRVMILLDISESMRLADYKPSRLSEALRLVKKIKTKFPNTEIIGFSGNVKRLSGNHLEAEDLISSVKKPGSSFGNALYLSAQAINTMDSANTLIILSDGDLTSGNISLEDALDRFKSKNLKAIVVGIGQNGPVLIGDNKESGEYVTDTFNSTALMTVSTRLNGEFIEYGIKDTASEIMRKIENYIYKN